MIEQKKIERDKEDMAIKSKRYGYQKKRYNHQKKVYA